MYDFGQFLAVGFAAAALFSLWVRAVPCRSRQLPHGVLTVAAIIVGSIVLPEDLDNFSRNFASSYSLATLIVFVSLLIPASAFIGRTASRLQLRWLALPLAMTILYANNLLLQRDYEGIHLMVTWAGATIVCTALVGSRLPQAHLRTWQRRALGVCGALVACWAVLVPPSSQVAVQLARVNGSVPAHYLGQLHSSMHESDLSFDEEIAPGVAEWFTDRETHPPIPARHTPPRPAAPIVILITIDSMRAELMEDRAYQSALPTLWEIAFQSTQFSNARAPGSSTMTVMASIFTGKHQTQLRWMQNRQTRLNLTKDNTPRITETMRDAGVPSFQAVSFEYLQTKYGITRGFTEEQFVQPPAKQRYGLSRDAITALISRLTHHKTGPLFLHAHLMDAHYPYDAAGSGPESEWDRYLAELSLCDESLGKLWEAVHKQGLQDRVVLIVTADHGEGFGQHNTPYHTNTVYDELVRVPLFVYMPHVSPGLTDASVSLIDLGPTILDIFGLASPGHHMGQTLTPLLARERSALTRPIAGVARGASDHPVFYYWMTDNHKIIWDRKRGTREIYNITRDPKEETNLFDELDVDSQRRMKQLYRFFGGHPFFKADEPSARGCASAPSR